MSDGGEGLPADEEELESEVELGSDEEEERGSSAEEGSDDEEEEEDDEEEEEEESPSARRRPKKKSKPFVAPPPRALPQRTTRGARMGNAVAEEGDEEFWNQEFFKEEENDERYETESEPEDRYDADFDESEEEGDEDAEAEEAEKAAAAKEPKKKVLKPPGYKKPPLPKPRPKDSGPAGKQTPAAKRSSIGPEDFAVERRTVRESTRQKVEEGELERKLAEKYKPRRAPQRSSSYRPLTQAELLAEAAKTEIENTRSLQLLVAIEEETKKKAEVRKRRYAGPMVRWKSRRVGDAEMTTLEVRNMAMPDELRPRQAPPPAPRLPCAITGQPARYRDPATGLPYASLEAYRELKKRREAGLLGPAGGAAGQASQQQQQQQTGAAQAGVSAASPGAQLRQSTQQAAQQQQQESIAAAYQQQQFGQQQQPFEQQQMFMQQQFGATPAVQQHFVGVPSADQQQLGGLPVQPVLAPEQLSVLFPGPASAAGGS